MQTPNRRFNFHKRSQLFIRVHNETLSVAAMCTGNEDRSSVAIHSCDTAQLQPALLRLSAIISQYFTPGGFCLFRSGAARKIVVVSYDSL
jgi:hypothetical protein